MAKGFKINLTYFIDGDNNDVEFRENVIKDLGHEAFYILDLLFGCIGFHILAVAGIVGNVINLVVLFRNGRNSTTNLMLISLSFSDFMYSFLMFFIKLKCVLSRLYVPCSTTYQTFTSVFLSSLASTMIVSSIFTVTVISVERLIAVSFPLHVARIFTPESTKRVVFVTYLVAFGLMSPWFFHASYVWTFTNNTTVAMETETPFYRENRYAIGTYVWGFLNVFCSVVTLIIISVCSVVIIVQLQHRTARSTKSNPKEMKVFKMLLLVCIITFVVWVPTAVIDMYHFYGTAPEKTLIVLNSVKHVLYEFSCGINFLIFVRTSSKFAATYKQLCYCHTKVVSISKSCC